MVNLISINAQSFTEIAYHANMLWFSSMTVIITLAMLWYTLGISAFAGVLIMIILIPVTSVISNKCKQLQTKKLKLQDTRIKTINEMLIGIKVIKLYAWELSLKDIINKIRNSELMIMRWMAFLTGTSVLTSNIAPFFVSGVSFGLFIYLNDKGSLNAEKAFVALTLFNLLKHPLFVLPITISNIIQVIY